MANRYYSFKNQGVELSKLVTLERIRQRHGSIPDRIIDKSLTTDEGKRVGRALLGPQGSDAELNETDRHYVEQIRSLAGSAS